MPEKKTYKIGYTAGVFDLFHIGHLNLLRNSKKICEYLVVGVNTDEFTLSYKGKKPIIPYEERADIVSAIKYIDEVFPNSSGDEWAVYNRYKYNVKTSGDDWAGNQSLMKFEKEIRPYGVDFVYFPYTKKTSSTLLAQVLNNIINK